MRPRYLLIIPSEDLAAGTAREVSQRTGLEIVSEGRTMVAFANARCTSLPLAKGGIVLGTLFPREGPMRAMRSRNGSDIALAIDGEDALLRHYWGGYVSAIVQGSSLRIMRDPSGALPCYWAQSGAAAFLASDVELLIAAATIRPILDIAALARFLYWDGLPVGETTWTGVRELLPGFGMVLGSIDPAPSPRWSPWDHVQPEPLEGSDRKAERLEGTVRRCTAAWASMHSRILVSVSGGLDSSIVVACLAAADIDASCLTMFTQDPSGDERVYARSLCEKAGLRLTESEFTLDAVDVDRALGSHLPRPIGRAQDQAYENAHLEVACAEGANAFFTGNGGDNVFGYSQSAAAIADRALREGASLGLARTVQDVCAHVGCGPWQAMRAALRIARRPRSYRWQPNPTFLSPELCETLHGQFVGHPWLTAPADALPGKAAHIAALLRTQMNLEPGRSRHAPVVNPLLSQPIVELSLAIQSWEWRAGGRDRALARDAFADALPREIVARKGKGTPDPFCAALIRHNRDRIRARLMDGRLAAMGLMDRTALETALRDNRMSRGLETVRLLQLINVEAWLEAWALPTGAIGDHREIVARDAVAPNG
ncbi:asparagine synthase-related protein [Sphingobium sp. YR657]|uniref:asparagine synthase-related protein n=1 Tax=Sphingobium sp. YR657 TaxID=1884366 RepID=UPI0009330CAF|nr:asparagine synthase-related protein [Sphingobium sp. YR657]